MALRVLLNLQTFIGRAEAVIAMTLVAGLLFVVNLQIISRYLFHHPFIWPEEVSRLLLVWITFFGAAAITRIGGDLAVDTFIEMLPHRRQRVMLMVRDGLMVVVFSIVALQGVQLANAVKNMPLVATGLPTALLAWPVVIGGFLVSFHCILRLIISFVSPAAEVPHTPKVLT